MIVGGVRYIGSFLWFSSVLPKQFGESIGVISDEECISRMDSRSTKGSASSQNYRRQIVVGDIFIEVESQQLLSLGDQYGFRLSGERKGFFPLIFYFVCNYEFGLLYIGIGQELLGSFTRSSTLSVIVPFDLFRHCFLCDFII